jgi:hypothetical protein
MIFPAVCKFNSKGLTCSVSITGMSPRTTSQPARPNEPLAAANAPSQGILGNLNGRGTGFKFGTNETLTGINYSDVR